ncbi:hypothetical protein D3C76_1612640 [compost metagenome]
MFYHTKIGFPKRNSVGRGEQKGGPLNKDFTYIGTIVYFWQAGGLGLGRGAHGTERSLTGLPGSGWTSLTLPMPLGRSMSRSQPHGLQWLYAHG